MKTNKGLGTTLVSRHKLGSTNYSIYRNKNSFTVSYFQFGRRIRKTYKTLTEAKDQAKKLKYQTEDEKHLVGQDLNEYRACIDILDDYANLHDLPDRPRMDTLINEAILARKKNHDDFVPKTTLAIWEELKTHKKSLNRSKSTVRGLNMVKPFCEMFPFEIHEITEQDVLEWNTSIIIAGRAPRTVYNYQAKVIEFFNYAQMMRYLPYGDHVANILQKKAIRSKRGVEEVQLWDLELLPTIFETASRMRCKTANKEVVIMVALAAFAGCRTCEISRMTWEQNVIWKTKYLRIPAAVSKNNKAHRKVAISPTLEAWLRYAGADENSKGPIAGTNSAQYVAKRLLSASERSGFEHVANGHRHTCISSWVATGVEIGQAALRSDNSPGIIKSNYLGEITEEEGHQWLETMPPGK